MPVHRGPNVPTVVIVLLLLLSSSNSSQQDLFFIFNSCRYIFSFDVLTAFFHIFWFSYFSSNLLLHPNHTVFKANVPEMITEDYISDVEEGIFIHIYFYFLLINLHFFFHTSFCMSVICFEFFFYISNLFICASFERRI